MTHRWDNRVFATFESMRDEVVFSWLESCNNGAARRLGDCSDAELVKEIYSAPEPQAWMKGAGLSRDDVVRGIRQARLAVEQQGLS